MTVVSVRSLWRADGLIVTGFVLAAIPAVFLLPPLPNASIAAGVLLAVSLIALSMIDVRTLRLPDVLTLPLLLCGLGLSVLLAWDSPTNRVLAVCLGFGGLALIGYAYERTRGRAGLGLGDAKLLAASGAWVGLEGLLTVVLIACATALVSAIVGCIATGRVTAETQIPFGPFLAIGTWATWLYGPMT